MDKIPGEERPRPYFSFQPQNPLFLNLNLPLAADRSTIFRLQHRKTATPQHRTTAAPENLGGDKPTRLEVLR